VTLLEPRKGIIQDSLSSRALYGHDWPHTRNTILQKSQLRDAFIAQSLLDLLGEKLIGAGEVEHYALGSRVARTACLRAGSPGATAPMLRIIGGLAHNPVPLAADLHDCPSPDQVWHDITSPAEEPRIILPARETVHTAADAQIRCNGHWKTSNAFYDR
jgi:hypothetical protein